MNQEGRKRIAHGKTVWLPGSTKGLFEVSVIMTVCFSPGSAGTE